MTTTLLASYTLDYSVDDVVIEPFTMLAEMLAWCEATHAQTPLHATQIEAACLLVARMEETVQPGQPHAVASLKAKPVLLSDVVPLDTVVCEQYAGSSAWRERHQAIIAYQRGFISRWRETMTVTSEDASRWYGILERLSLIKARPDQAYADVSIGQAVDICRMLLEQRVTMGEQRDDMLLFTVHGSKAYRVTVSRRGYHHGCACTCKGYWANGGGGLCKHILAAYLTM